MEEAYLSIIYLLIAITCVQFLACMGLFIYFVVQLRNAFKDNRAFVRVSTDAGRRNSADDLLSPSLT